MSDSAFLELFQRLSLALAIGFLVGVERGWTHRDAADGSRAAGLRTHALIGLLGGVSAALLPHIGHLGFAALTLSFGVAFVAFKLHESQHDHDLSVTGTIAGLLVYALGAYAVLGDGVIAAAAGVAVVALLAFKYALHAWLDKLTWEELRSALLILAATAIALPLLPSGAIDPWSAVRPRELWLLTILVACASFLGYAAVRVLGARFGLLTGAAAGALVSSTIITADLGRRVRAGEASASHAASAAALAGAVSVTRAGLLATAAAPAVGSWIAAPLAAAALAFVATAFALNMVGSATQTAPHRDRLRNPLNVGEVVKFALLLGTVIAVGRVISDAFGQRGLLPFAMAAGIADVDAAALAAGALVRGGLAASVGAQAILLAILVNTFAKSGVAWISGGKRYAAYYLASAVAASAAALAAWLAFGAPAG